MGQVKGQRMSKLSVGQKLWLVQSSVNRREDPGREVAVTKVGRKWAEVTGWGNLRIDVATLQTEYKGCGCYISQRAYLAKLEVRFLASSFVAAIRNNQGAIFNLTANEIRRAADALGLELGVPPKIWMDSQS